MYFKIALKTGSVMFSIIGSKSSQRRMPRFLFFNREIRLNYGILQSVNLLHTTCSFCDKFFHYQETTDLVWNGWYLLLGDPYHNTCWKPNVKAIAIRWLCSQLTINLSFKHFQHMNLLFLLWAFVKQLPAG